MSAKNFRKELEALDRKVRNKIIKKAQKDALKELAAKIRQDAPVDSGELRSSIKIKVGPRKKDHIVTVINISTPDDNPHAARVELGTKDVPAEPFIRPAVKELRDEVIQLFKDNLEVALNNI